MAVDDRRRGVGWPGGGADGMSAHLGALRLQAAQVHRLLVENAEVSTVRDGCAAGVGVEGWRGVSVLWGGSMAVWGRRRARPVPLAGWAVRRDWPVGGH